MEPMAIMLRSQSCSSGIFVMLEATVNSDLPDADNSRSGIYLCRNRYLHYTNDISLFRGDSAVARSKGIDLHRQWKLEFRTAFFSQLEQLKANAAKPLHQAYLISQRMTLPGTSDDVILITVPLVGTDGTFYGVCGYEISADYFSVNHAQSSNSLRLLCAATPDQGDLVSLNQGLSCSSTEAHVQVSDATLSVSTKSAELLRFTGESDSFVGIRRSLLINDQDTGYILSVMIPEEDYTDAVIKNILLLALLLALLLFFAGSCCLFFSRQFLKPILHGLDQIKQAKLTEATSSVQEIRELHQFLADQNELNSQALQEMQQKHYTAETRLEQAQQHYDQALKELTDARKEIDRLAYSRSNEVDPDDYAVFLNGISTLTKTERMIFDYYVDGKTSGEILELTGTKESTLKFHNHNILNKLGVSSRKQMLRYAALMKQTNAAP